MFSWNFCIEQAPTFRMQIKIQKSWWNFQFPENGSCNFRKETNSLFPHQISIEDNLSGRPIPCVCRWIYCCGCPVAWCNQIQTPLCCHANLIESWCWSMAESYWLPEGFNTFPSNSILCPLPMSSDINLPITVLGCFLVRHNGGRYLFKSQDKGAAVEAWPDAENLLIEAWNRELLSSVRDSYIEMVLEIEKLRREPSSPTIEPTVGC